jgi:hypothetical protein
MSRLRSPCPLRLASAAATSGNDAAASRRTGFGPAKMSKIGAASAALARADAPAYRSGDDVAYPPALATAMLIPSSAKAGGPAQRGVCAPGSATVIASSFPGTAAWPGATVRSPDPASSVLRLNTTRPRGRTRRNVFIEPYFRERRASDRTLCLSRRSVRQQVVLPDLWLDLRPELQGSHREDIPRRAPRPWWSPRRRRHGGGALHDATMYGDSA